MCRVSNATWKVHDDVIKWKHIPRYWPFVRGIHRSPVNSPHKGQWRGALMFPLICVWINGWANNREAGDLRRHRAHYDVTLMLMLATAIMSWISDPIYYFLSDLITHPCPHISGGLAEWLLPHRGRVTHICVGNLTNIGSENGLSPGRRQAINWTNAGI